MVFLEATGCAVTEVNESCGEMSSKSPFDVIAGVSSTGTGNS
jgi:hypothetical protein